jgi:hypothetical protein
LEGCDLTLEPRYADISFTLAGELFLRNPARGAFECRHFRSLPVQLRGSLFHITLGCEPLALKSLRSAQLGFSISDGRFRFANPILRFFCANAGRTLLFKAGFLLVADLCAQSLNLGPQSSGSRLLLAQLQLVRNRINLDEHFAAVDDLTHAKTGPYHTAKKRRLHGVGGAVEFHARFLRNLV